ncbi:hypothetical protein ACJ72_05116 [Emergomyces africanus]|uniref:L-gulonate 3-dehydrogenase n=1 Tax=Emergomyces africanus TaxID=1955775 RepID=A0A1B7NUX8_9EURO|nr:hypothetical protein ACJ72_05116 [Emergomyces africanus]
MSADKLPKPTRIVLIGSGTIGLSFAALHLTQSPDVEVTIYDPRSDLKAYIDETLPVQEQGPETPTFKQSIWSQIETHAPAHALFWTSTSGIPASTQTIHMRDKSRLIVVHPYNPPHIMPLLELVPSPATPPELIERTFAYWKALKRAPVLLKREMTGFVANRLAYALLREAVHLVQEGVVGVEELDAIVENSMGPRWTIAGPFKSYHMGGGKGGLRAFFEKIGGTVQACWDDQGGIGFGRGEDWEEAVFRETEEIYGPSAGC